MSESAWLPNLVAGTSIWKLAVDLNEGKFFDGRLLVPETEGSESLPVTVRWDLTGLISLKEARANHPEDAAAAVRDFQACLERVAKVFSTPNSGFDKYKDAFTVPSIEADDGANYFYSPDRKKLFVINWGASPRSMGGKAEYVFGYEDWAKHWADPPTLAASAGAALTGATAAAAVEASEVAKAEAKTEERQDEKKPKKARPWWIWPLFALVAITLVLLALFLLKACDEPKSIPTADASDALAVGSASDGAADGEAGATAAADGGDAGIDGATTESSDAGSDASASGDGGKDGGMDGGRDGGLALEDDDDDGDEGSSGGSSGGTLSSGGASGGASGGNVVVKVGPGGGEKTSVHRKHYSDEAVKWRVAAGGNKVSRTEQRGQRFDVWLSPGHSFEGVRVEWQDKSGKWHVH